MKHFNPLQALQTPHKRDVLSKVLRLTIFHMGLETIPTDSDDESSDLLALELELLDGPPPGRLVRVSRGIAGKVPEELPVVLSSGSHLVSRERITGREVQVQQLRDGRLGAPLALGVVQHGRVYGREGGVVDDWRGGQHR